MSGSSKLEATLPVRVEEVRARGVLRIDVAALEAARSAVGLSEDEELGAALGLTAIGARKLQHQVPGPILRRQLAALLGVDETTLYRLTPAAATRGPSR